MNSTSFKPQTPTSTRVLYEKLDASRKDIRLLELDCSRSDESHPLKCNLVKSQIGGSLPYEALSYVWGDVSQRVPLSVNGQTLLITRNVDSLLRHLVRPTIRRATDEASGDSVSNDSDRIHPAGQQGGSLRRVWIDAVCINQDDLQERSNQVKLMFDLYSQASRMLIWLGEAKDDSDLAMDLVCQLQANQLQMILAKFPQLGLSPFEKSQIDKWSSHPPWYHRLMRLHGSAGGEHLNPQDPPEWVAFQRLMDRPWWERMWVVQELVASHRKAVVGCGSKWIPWSSFAVANGAILQFKNHPFTMGLQRLAAKSDLISELDSMCLRSEKEGHSGLPGVLLPLLYTAAKKSSLPVDRLYGLTGIFSAFPFDPDYNKPPGEVYRAFVKYTIHRWKTLALLTFNRFPKNLDLPSWLPDFSCEFHADDYNIIIPRGVYGADGFFGHNMSIGSPGCDLQASDGPDELTVLGLIHDQPVYVAEPWQAPPGERESCLRRLAKEYKEKVKMLEGRFSKKDLDEALWRTLIWDATPESSSPAPSEYASSLEAVIEPSTFLMGSRMTANGYEPMQTYPTIPPIGIARQYYDSMLKHSLNRRFFITSKGHLGCGPKEMRADDLVCVLVGFKTPVILRKHASGDLFQWVGAAYVHDIMRGESLRDASNVRRTLTLR